MHRSRTQDATTTAKGNVVTYKALLEYYSNVSNAASHFVSLSLPSLNETVTLGVTGSVFGNVTSIVNSTTDFEDDELDANSFYVITERSESDLSIGLSSSRGDGVGSGGGGGVGSGVAVSGGGSLANDMPVWLIPTYSGILLFAVLGNLLVISTLMQNRRMRTITNLFLLNLAISDILLGVLCMPVTLVGTLLRNFIFGEFLCKLIQFSQGKFWRISNYYILPSIIVFLYYILLGPLQ